MEEEKQDTEYCSNCKKDIPANNFVMHAQHCQRHITLCDLCGEPVPKSQKDEHFEEYHAKVKCKCGEVMEQRHLDEHKDNECKSRKTNCEYCELELTVGEMDSHEEYCGSRTELCEKCNQRIQHRDLEEHLLTCSFDKNKPTSNNNTTTASSSSQNGFSRRPPEEMVRNFGFRDFDDFGLPGGPETFHHLLTNGFGMLPQQFFDNGNVFPSNTVPSDNVVARGFSSNHRNAREPRNERSNVDNRLVNDDRDMYERTNLERDELMAALLACADDDERDSAEGSYGGFKEPLPGISPAHNNHNMHLEDDDADFDETVLPCEFCGEPIKAQDLIQHQTGCQLTSGDSPGLYPQLRSQPRSLPPLGPDTNLQDDEKHNDDIEHHDETFLPCEFCQDLFPYDALIGHQSICDPDRSRPPSAIQTFHATFFESDGQPSNYSKPRTRSRPVRPSRPVVTDNRYDEQDLNLFNPASDLRSSRGADSNGTISSDVLNTNLFNPEGELGLSRGTYSNGNNDNRLFSHLDSQNPARTQRNNDVDSRSRGLASNSVSLTVRNKQVSQSGKKRQGNRTTASTAGRLHSPDPSRPLRVSNDDRKEKFVVALPKRTFSGGYKGFQDIPKNSPKSELSENGQYRNGTRSERSGDEPRWEMRPLQETGTTPSANQHPPSNGISSGTRSIQHTTRTRRQMQALAPSFDNQAISRDNRHKEVSRDHQTQTRNGGSSGRREQRNTERGAQGTSGRTNPKPKGRSSTKKIV